VTIAKRPSIGTGWQEYRFDLAWPQSRKFFRARLDRANQLEMMKQIRFYAHAPGSGFRGAITGHGRKRRHLGQSPRFAPEHHSLLLIGCAIMVGHAEGRPMNTTKIAHYIGLPRTTVIRKLNEFLRSGVIARYGNVYLLSEERAHNQTKYVAEAMRIFHTAEKSLKASKLET
jgi:Crp-like helix-turn-helix domain